ncbi:MAG: kelch motif-containing protein [Cytophagaceae bacterium]|nr:kelch motif-containing protein [Cytophagaceae bacterium]
MKKRYQVLSHILFLSTLLLYAMGTQAQWSTASLSQARFGLSATSAGGKAFFAGGYGQISSLQIQTNRVDIYDTATNTWSTATLSQGRNHLSATSAGGKAFFAGG